MERLTLDGAWSYRRHDEDAWREIVVPGCWEADGRPKLDAGPYVFRHELEVPAAWRGRRLWLRFDGVSYHARVRVDGREVGAHTGIWDAFAFDVTDALEPGTRSVVEVEVTKPAALLDGPDGPVAAGPFPLRETLAGFLPYVWGSVFGGIWQGVALEATRAPAPIEVSARGAAVGAADGAARGRYELTVAFAEEAEAELVLLDPDGAEVARHAVRGRRHEVAGALPAPRVWAPAAPQRYALEVRAAGEVLARRRFGFRSVARDGATLLLNGEVAYPRMILSWGWYPDALHANPAPEVVRQDFERLRAMGFDGVKYCLWVPPEHVLDAADELGMVVWLELPMWLPRVTYAFLAQTLAEYERIVRAVRHHPSIVLYSLGCELSSAVGAELLERLYRQTKALVGDALVRDNSGSGEAYGGLLDEYAEYYDYHFYAELPTFRPLLDHFAPRTRPEQPFLFGEFCDSDTFRDLRELDAGPGGRPWWATADPDHHPKGARWQYDIPWLEERLRASGMWERGAELAAVSRKQALLQRKATLETLRTYREVSGYVITGERDTPISTAGVFDDRGEPKFDATAFASFNGPTVLALAWDRRRAWVHGGDRPAPWDPYGYRAGDAVRAKLVVAHHGRASGHAEVTWHVTDAGGAEVAAGEDRSVVAFAAGMVREATIARFAAPAVAAPTQLTLHASVTIGEERSTNAWPLWVFPRRDPAAAPRVAVHDPEGVLAGVERLWPVAESSEGAAVTLATEWSPELDARVRAGGRALLLVRGRTDDPVPSAPMPFWREAVKLLEPHPAWGDFPQEGWTDLQFYGVAPDRALAIGEALAASCAANPSFRPHERVLTRVDGRTAAVHAYAAVLPWGEGRLFATTLRFGGALGDQAVGIGRNVCAQELLANWLRWLARAS